MPPFASYDASMKDYHRRNDVVKLFNEQTINIIHLINLGDTIIIIDFATKIILKMIYTKGWSRSTRPLLRLLNQFILFVWHLAILLPLQRLADYCKILYCHTFNCFLFFKNFFCFPYLSMIFFSSFFIFSIKC